MARAVNETGCLVFIDEVTADKSSRMITEMFKTILSAHFQPNGSELFWPPFTIQMDNNAKYTAKAKRGMLCNGGVNHLTWTQVSWHFTWWKQNWRENVPSNIKQELKTVAVGGWQSISLDEIQHLVVSINSRLQAAIYRKGFATKYFAKIKLD